MSNPTSSDYTSIIADLDKVLDTARLFWQDARDDKEREKYRKQLDSLLDQRLEFMKKRDADKKKNTL